MGRGRGEGGGGRGEGGGGRGEGGGGRGGGEGVRETERQWKGGRKKGGRKTIFILCYIYDAAQVGLITPNYSYKVIEKFTHNNGGIPKLPIH